jgi:hypothetical protein
MANTRSAAKQARGAIKRRAQNRIQITTVRTSEKKIRALAKAGKTDEAVKLLPQHRFPSQEARGRLVQGSCEGLGFSDSRTRLGAGLTRLLAHERKGFLIPSSRACRGITARLAHTSPDHDYFLGADPSTSSG